jgi:peptide/nickel transport system substrate-binding protein
MKFLLLFCGLLLAPFAQAAGVENCGTVVIPPGLGVSSSADITSFNPLMVTSEYNAEAANLMYQPLLWINGKDDKIDWSRSVASAVTTPDNGITYNVTLGDWKWSDGVPVTSADVAYTFKLIKELGTSYVGYGSGGMPDIIKSFSIQSPTQFQVVLTHRVNPTWFIYNGLALLQPTPAHAWGKYSLNQIFQLQSSPKFFSVVDGPLFVKRLDVGLDLVMVPNANYSGPHVHFSRLIFKFLESDGQAVEDVESRDLDMANVPDALWNAVQHLPGIHLVTLPPGEDFNYIALNFRDPAMAFFRDARVRDAMADALDQAGMIKLVYHGLGVEIHGPVPPVPPTFLSPEMKAGNYPVGYDPAKARALLQQAGFAPGPDGIMEKDGKKLSFTYLMSSGDALIEQSAEYEQANFAKIGIQMKIHEIEFNQMLALLDNPHAHWEAAGLAQSYVGYPSGELLFKTGSYYNSGGYSNPEMDRLIQQSTETPGLSGLYAYENFASAQQPVIFQARDQTSVLFNDRIRGVRKFVDSMGNYYPDALYCPAGHS